MIDAQGLLNRQGAWQRARAELSWAEKIDRAARVRNDVARVRAERSGRSRQKPPESGKKKR